MESKVLKGISRLNRQANQNRNCRVKVEPDHEMLAITPNTAMFFSVLLKAIKTRRILKVGASVMFSTLWFVGVCENDISVYGLGLRRRKTFSKSSSN